MLAEFDYVGYNYITKANKDYIDKERPVIMFELDFFCENSGYYATINDKEIPILKNTVLCLKPKQKLGLSPISRFYSINFDTKNEKLYNNLLTLPDTFTVENTELYKNIFLEAEKYFNINSYESKIMLESLLLKLIYNLKCDSNEIPAHFFEASSSRQTEIIKKTVKYIKDNLTEDLSLESLANKFSISPIHFHNIFKTVMHKTPRVFVEERRIKKACDLLVTTNLSFSEIAFECGFSSQSYFCYAFKRYMGTTPKKYIEKFISR